jgi:adenine-specific DNA-methyltransferase
MAGKTSKSVENFIHDEASRKYIPTAELESLVSEEDKTPIEVAYKRRNPDLDPQLVWRGKDLQNWSDLVVQAPPLYIQEKIHPKVLIDELQRMTENQEQEEGPQQLDFFADFNGLPSEAARTEFYQHDANWSNRMILGDSLQVMASLAEREGLRGQVQCIYIDPPYGIRFNSNFQWSTTTRNVTDGKVEHITREPEQVKAFRDTWRDGIHSYLTYLRDRIILAHDLLSDSGSIFIQIGDENVHRIRLLLDEVFGDENSVATITYKTSIGLGSKYLDAVTNYLIWYAKDKEVMKYRPLFKSLRIGRPGATRYLQAENQFGVVRRLRREEISNPELIPSKWHPFFRQGLTSRTGSKTTMFEVNFHGKTYRPTAGGWRTNEEGMDRLRKANRIAIEGRRLTYKKFFSDFGAISLTNFWGDVGGGIQSRSDPKVYVVQTATNIVERCLLMCTDPGDLVLDPTSGSGTTSMVAEKWGRRWIAIDTSRVALALSRARIMGARYPFFILADSPEGQEKEIAISQKPIYKEKTQGLLRLGFVYDRLRYITLRTIAHNQEIDVIWDTFNATTDTLTKQLNRILGETWEEWEIPPKSGTDWPKRAKELHSQLWEQRIARQNEIDASIAAKADYEYLYDKPYEDNNKVRVAGPFTVESLSPHRMLGVDENDELIDNVAEGKAGYAEGQSFVEMILENLKTAGVQQAHKEDKINFSSLTPWPGEYICAEGRYFEGDDEKGVQKRAAIFLGPEFGTVARPDLVAAAREAADAGFDVLVACAFNYDAQSTEFDKLGRVPVLKARMNADLHMADDLKNTGKGNLFVIFGEPDIDILEAENGQIRAKINGVDVFDPSTGEVRSDSAEGIACWFIDTDYNEESFFVRHAYFLGANDPYKSLKTTLKAEINREAWESLHSDTSRPFDKPASGRIAVKVINHLGDEVMKVFRVD